MKLTFKKVLVVGLGGWVIYKLFSKPTPKAATVKNLEVAKATGGSTAEQVKIAMTDPNVSAYADQVNASDKPMAEKVALVSSAVENVLDSTKGPATLGGLGDLGKHGRRRRSIAEMVAWSKQADAAWKARRGPRSHRPGMW